MPRVFVIDGRDFSTLEEFFETIGSVLIPRESWGKNLTAFNDILCWPVNKDRESYILVWKHSNVSRKRLNHLEAERHLQQVIERYQLPSRSRAAQEMERAGRCEGPTAFDWLVEIIERHPDWLTLKLE